MIPIIEKEHFPKLLLLAWKAWKEWSGWFPKHFLFLALKTVKLPKLVHYNKFISQQWQWVFRRGSTQLIDENSDEDIYHWLAEDQKQRDADAEEAAAQLTAQLRAAQIGAHDEGIPAEQNKARQSDEECMCMCQTACIVSLNR